MAHLKKVKKFSLVLLLLVFSKNDIHALRLILTDLNVSL